MIRKFIAALAGVALACAGLAGPAEARPVKVSSVAPLTKPVTRPVGVKAAKSMSGPLVHEYVAGQMASSLGTPLPAGTDGMSGVMTIEHPTVDVANGDYFSLMELAGLKTITTGGSAQRNAIEIGWEVNPPHYGDTNPHLFVGAWKHGTFLGRNAAGGFVDASPNTPNAADSVLADVGTYKTFAITYFSGNWWVAYTTVGQPTNYVGYFPGTIWTNTGPASHPTLPAVSGFTGLDEAQWFGEVVVDSTGPQNTDMGDGSCGSTATTPLATASDPAFATALKTIVGASTTTNANISLLETQPTKWDGTRFSGVTMALGGGGTGTC